MDEMSAARSHAMDELEAVHRLLAQPPPSPEVVEAARASLGRAGVAPRRDGSPVHLNGGRHMFGAEPPARRRRWRGWLAPVAAAAAVVAVVAGSLAVSGAIGHHTGPRRTTDSAAAAVARAGVPRYFVALPGPGDEGSGGPTATVGVTATGKVLGTVAAPKPYGVFDWATASGNDRVFVLAAQRPMKRPGPSHYRFYRLVLSRSGRPGPLTPLAIPAQTGYINGFALSPDGSKLAMSFIPGYTSSQPSKIEVFTLATGAGQTWTWPGAGNVGWDKPVARSLSWESDNRTLLFRQTTWVSHRQKPETGTSGARLLDTATSGGDLKAASRLVPIPSQELTGLTERGLNISGPMLITGDGTEVVAPTTTLVSIGTAMLTRKTAMYLELYRQCGASVDGFTKQNGHYTAVNYVHYRKTPHCLKLIQERDQYFKRNVAPRADHLKPETSDITITEFSAKTGKPALVLDRQATQDQGWTDVQWTSTSGTSLIVDVPGPPGADHVAQQVIGVQDSATFTPLPARAQRAFQTEQIAW
jgi:hypothetical protein